MGELDMSLRSSGLGGSDIVALFGESRRTRIDVWLEKTGQSEPFEGNERTHWGNILEPVVASYYADSTGYHLESYPTLRSIARPWHIGTPDRGCFESDVPVVRSTVCKVAKAEDGTLYPRPDKPHRGLEIKTHGFRGGSGYGEEGSDEVPDDKRLQAAWYMALMDVDEWDIAALIDTHLYRVFHVERDLEVEGFLLEEAERFWTRNVLANVPPPPDGTESFGRYLAKRFGDHSAATVMASDEVANLVIAERTYAEREKAAKQDRERVQQQIKLAIGPNLGLHDASGDVICTWKRRAAGVVAPSKMQERLVARAGLTDAEVTQMEDACRGTAPRVFLNKVGRS